MKPFDARKGKKLSKKIVSYLRFFGFYIGNTTILAGTKWGVGYDISIISEIPKALGHIFTLELFRHYDEKGNSQKTSPILDTEKISTILIGEYIESLHKRTEFPFSFEEIQSSNQNNWRDVMVRFFKDFGMKILCREVLNDFSEDDYECFISDGNYLEKVTAIFCNILRMDKNFNVINEEWARYRASQYIRLICDESDTYKVIPPFKEWETMLWL